MPNKGKPFRGDLHLPTSAASGRNNDTGGATAAPFSQARLHPAPAPGPLPAETSPGTNVAAGTGSLRSEAGRAEFSPLDQKLDKIVSSTAAAVRLFKTLEEKFGSLAEDMEKKLADVCQQAAEDREQVQRIMGLLEGLSEAYAGAGDASEEEGGNAAMGGTEGGSAVVSVRERMAHQRLKREILESMDGILAAAMQGSLEFTRHEIKKQVGIATVGLASLAIPGGPNGQHTPLEKTQAAIISKMETELQTWRKQHNELLDKHTTAMAKYDAAMKVNQQQMSSNSVLTNRNTRLSEQAKASAKAAESATKNAESLAKQNADLVDKVKDLRAEIEAIKAVLKTPLLS